MEKNIDILNTIPDPIKAILAKKAVDIVIARFEKGAWYLRIAAYFMKGQEDQIVKDIVDAL